MRVKIGDTIYNPNNQPVMIYLSDHDKANIKNMHDDATVIGCFPENTPHKEMEEHIDQFNRQVRVSGGTGK